MKKILSLFLVLILSVTVAACFAACDDGPAQLNPDPIDDNYRVFYQIFVGSFSDSDGDGVGDIRGIINRMDYLNDGDYEDGKSLGVQGLWLSPIFTSPSYHKYDTTDYYQVDPQFGTLEDLQELLTICHQRNVKVILDLAINHSSKRNEWFTTFEYAHKNNKTDSSFYDYYTWVTADQREGGKTYERISGTDEYYECNFSSSMPEFNYDNETVRNKMVDVAKYWLDLGVDGFRFDAVKYIYYNDTASSVDFWKWYMAQLRTIKPDIYAVGECWSADSEVLEYYPALNCFNFSVGGPEGKVADGVRNENANYYAMYIESYLKSMKQANPDGMFMPFLSNHDQDRAAGYLMVSNNNAKMAANFYILCSGSPVIYYGEEIGMKGTRGGASSDANRRLAMLWGDKDKISDPSEADFDSKLQINGTVKSQKKDKNSLLNHYIQLLMLRNKYPAIARGDYAAITCKTSVACGFKITYNGQTILLFHNVSTYDTVEIPLPDGFTQVGDFIGNGAEIVNGTLRLSPQTSVIVK